MFAALRTAVASVSSELAEKNAVARVLAQHGHRRLPAVVSQRDASGVTRVYLWDDAGIALVTGPSLQGTVYEVHAVPAGVDPTSFDLFIPAARGRSAFAAGRKAKALANPAPARAPLAQAPRRIVAAPAPQLPTRQPAVLARHNAPTLSNPPKGPPASIPGPSAFLPAAADEYGYNILAKIVGNNAVYSVKNALIATVIRRIVKDIGLANTVSVEKGEGSTYDATFHPKDGGLFAGSTKATLNTVMAVNLGGNYGGMGFAQPKEQDPYADYSGPVATLFYAPYVNYVEALLFGALAANGIASLPSYTPPAVNAVPGAAAGASKATGQVAILFEPGVGLFVSGETFDAKEAIKNEGFLWTGKEGKYGYPKSVWAAANSDQATSESSLVGWQGEKKTVTATIDALKAALAAKGLSVSVETPTGGMTSSPAASADPKPPPVSPLPVDGIPVSFSSGRFKALAPNPVWAEGGGVNAIAARLKQTGSKPGGGLAGGVYTDSLTGLKYLAKFPPNEQMVGSEVLASHLYRALGVVAPDMRPAVVDGKPTILSPWIDGMKKFATSVSGWNANVPAIEKKWLASSFPSDVWLADYDVVGLEWDNLLSLPDGHPIRIDPGASLMFRAGGQLKSPLPGTDAGVELDSMLFQPKGDKIQHVFAEAKDDPALMVPLATAIETYMQKGYLDAVAKWAGYTSKVGLPTGYSIGDYLFIRGQGLSMAVAKKAKAVAPAPAPAYDAAKLAKAVAATLGGTYNLSGGFLPTVTVGQFTVGFGQPLNGQATAIITKYDDNGPTDAGVVTMPIPPSGTTAFFSAAVGYFSSQIVAKIAAFDVPVVPAPAPAPAASSGGLVESIAKKIAALLPGTTASGTSVGPWTVVAFPGNGIMLESKGGVLTALILAGGDETQKLEYTIPSSGSLLSFTVSRAADIANAFKPYSTKATPKPAPSAASMGTGAGLTEVSLTEIDALPEGSVVTAAASPGETFYVRDSSGLWRELTEDGDFMPGLFSDDVYDTLDGEVLLAYEGSGTGPEGDDPIMLSTYYTMAQQAVSIKTKGAVATLLGPKPTAPKPTAPKPAPAAAPAPYGDPNPWPTTGFATDLGPDPVWVQVGGSLVLASRLATANFGGKLGSFPGGKVTDPLTKGEFYVKFFTNAEHALTEALASHLYRILGINAPDVRWAPAHLFGSKGSGGYKVGLISPWKGSYIQRANGSFDPAERQFLRREFPADVWMANYDVVGKGPATKYDNLLVTDDFGNQNPKHYLRIDQGAALDYRSTGSTKKSGQDWSTNVAQTWDDFLSSAHPTIYKVFKDATPTTGAVMIERIWSLVGTPAFMAALNYAGRSYDLANVLKDRASHLSGMLAAETPAPVAALPPAGPTEVFVGMKAMATTLKPMIKSEKWSVLKKDDGSIYIAGFGAGLAMEIGPQGFAKGVEAIPLPAGGYEVVAVGEQVGSTSPVTLYAQYSQPVAAPAPTPSLAAPPKKHEQTGTIPSLGNDLTVPQDVVWIGEQVRQILVAKGFDAVPHLALTTLFKVRLYEGGKATEPIDYPVKFPMQESKVLVKLGADDVGLFSPGKAGVENAIAAALLAALRLKMANLNLTKKPLGVPAAAPMPAVPMGGPVTIGSILTTMAQVEALPVGSVIAYGNNFGPNTTDFVALYRCVDSDEWMLTTFSGELKTGSMTTSEMAPSSEQWGVVVLRVGGEGDLPEPFYEHLMDVTGKSSKAILSSFSIGA